MKGRNEAAVHLLPFGLWLRRRLPETLHRVETPAMAVENNETAKTLRGNSRLLGLGLVILASGTIITYVTQYMTTYAQHTLHVDAPLAFATTVVSNGVGIAAALLGGWLADRAGRWPIMVWPQIAALLLTYPVFLWVVESRNSMALLGGLGLLALIGSIPYSAFYVGLRRSFAQEHPRRRFCNHLCGCDRNIRWHRPARCRLADGSDRQRAGARLVLAARDGCGTLRHDIHAGNRALKGRGFR